MIRDDDQDRGSVLLHIDSLTCHNMQQWKKQLVKVIAEGVGSDENYVSRYCSFVEVCRNHRMLPRKCTATAPC